MRASMKYKCYSVSLIVDGSGRIRDAYAGGQEGQLPPLPSFMMGQEGQELPFILNSFHLSYLLKGNFPAFQTVW